MAERPFPWGHLRFTLVSFLGSILALYWSLRLDLQQPYWSMTTAYIVSQPVAAAVRSRSLYRLLGTVLGASAAVFLVPRLVHAPLLLSFALSCWVGACLAVSLLDRTPRSYVVMLAGYTATIIGFSSVAQPERVFDVAVARAEEISIGIICATLAHSLLFPQPIGRALCERIRHWFGEAERWALDIVRGEDFATARRDRIRLAEAASEIQIQATLLPFDLSSLREATALVHALRDRMLAAIPLLASLSERLVRPNQPAVADEEMQRLLVRTREWIESGVPLVEARALEAALAAFARNQARDDWQALERLAVAVRLQELVHTLAEGRLLLERLQDPSLALPEELQRDVAQTQRRPLHRDFGLAVRSGFVALLATMIACIVWIGLGWNEGGASATNASVACCMFAAMDDPAPAIKRFALAVAAALVLAGIYLFAIFPRIDSYPLLVLVLAPMLLFLGWQLNYPNRMLTSMFVLVNFCSAMAIQERYSPDFAYFLNSNLSQFFGMFVAIYVTRLMRTMSAAASARRLLRQTWRSLARLARRRGEREAETLLSPLVDRLALLAPRLADVEEDGTAGLEVLRDVRVGADLATLQEVRGKLPPPARRTLELLLRSVGRLYAARSRGEAPPAQPLPALLERSRRALAAHLPPAETLPFAALVGLRHHLVLEAAQ